MSKITVLMPVYNGIEFINESVKSIVNQTYSNWELIIGINGHPENSNVYKRATIFESKQNIHVLDMPHIHNKSDALNEMMKYVKTDWICLLDVDDKWKLTKLESQIKYIDTYDVIGTHTQYFGDLNIMPNIPTGDISDKDFMRLNPIINSSCLVKKKYCYWDNTYNGVEDYDMWLRLRYIEKCKFFNVPTVETYHRIHKESAFNAGGKNNMSVPILLNKYRSIIEKEK